MHLHDEWEHFTIKFNINYGIDNDNYSVRINGSLPELGEWDKGCGPIKMERCQRPREYMMQKYGSQIKPWEFYIKLKNDFNDKFDLINKSTISYKYSIKTDLTDDEQW